MDIGQAVDALRQGKRIARAGWNGKLMHVEYVPGAAATETCRQIDPSMNLHTAKGTIQPGWNASTPDLFALDWEVVG